MYYYINSMNLMSIHLYLVHLVFVLLLLFIFVLVFILLLLYHIHAPHGPILVNNYSITNRPWWISILTSRVPNNAGINECAAAHELIPSVVRHEWSQNRYSSRSISYTFYYINFTQKKYIFALSVRKSHYIAY